MPAYSIAQAFSDVYIYDDFLTWAARRGAAFSLRLVPFIRGVHIL